MGDSLNEPRKHTKLYDELCLRLIGGDTRARQVVGEINEMMRRHNLSISEFQQLTRYVCERQRWAEYAIRQLLPRPDGEAVPDDDEESES